MASATKGKHVIIAAQCNDHSAYLAGVPFKRFYTEARTFARVQLLVSEYYGLMPRTIPGTYTTSKPKPWGKRLSIIPTVFRMLTEPIL